MATPTCSLGVGESPIAGVAAVVDIRLLVERLRPLVEAIAGRAETPDRTAQLLTQLEPGVRRPGRASVEQQHSLVETYAHDLAHALDLQGGESAGLPPLTMLWRLGQHRDIARAISPSQVPAPIGRERPHRNPMTAQELATHAGMTFGTVSRLESAKSAPAWATFRALTETLECSFSELAAEIERQERAK